MRNNLNRRRSNLRAAAVSRPKNGSGKHVLLGLKLGTLFVAAFVICNTYVYLGQRIKTSDKAIGKHRRELVQLDREIRNLGIERQTLSRWDNISAKIADYKLGLRAPRYGQTRKLVIRTAAPYAGTGAIRIGSR